jgi:hypothetical protein
LKMFLVYLNYFVIFKYLNAGYFVCKYSFLWFFDYRSCQLTAGL